MPYLETVRASQIDHHLRNIETDGIKALSSEQMEKEAEPRSDFENCTAWRNPPMEKIEHFPDCRRIEKPEIGVIDQGVTNGGAVRKLLHPAVRLLAAIRSVKNLGRRFWKTRRIRKLKPAAFASTPDTPVWKDLADRRCRTADDALA